MKDNGRQQKADTPITSTQPHQLPARACSTDRIKNSLGPSIYRTHQPTRLPRQMESHVHRQEMSKRASCDLADRALGDGREDCVSEF